VIVLKAAPASLTLCSVIRIRRSRALSEATTTNTTPITNFSLTFFDTGTNVLNGVPENQPPQASLVRLNIRPLLNAFGDAWVNLKATDGRSGVATQIGRIFKVTVADVVLAPVITRLMHHSIPWPLAGAARHPYSC
jgi:hypothetical protein